MRARSIVLGSYEWWFHPRGILRNEIWAIEMRTSLDLVLYLVSVASQDTGTGRLFAAVGQGQGRKICRCRPGQMSALQVRTAITGTYVAHRMGRLAVAVAGARVQ
eukprot:COSAG01_NODE_18610_length_1064_cov_17.141969_1_plen_105_part_00